MLCVIDIGTESSRFSIVMLKHAAETLLAFDLSNHEVLLHRLNRHIADALVWPLGVVVFDVLIEHVPQLLLSEEDHLVQAFLLDGSDEALRVGVEVRRARRQLLA